MPDELNFTRKRDPQQQTQPPARAPSSALLRQPKMRSRTFHDSLRAANERAQAISFRESSADSSVDSSFLELSSFYDPDCDDSYLTQCFSFLTKIGEGSFAEVYKARSKDDGQLYAIKMSRLLYRSEGHRNERLEEVRRYEQFSDHNNCVRFYRAWEQNERLYIQMELCRENLSSYLLSHQNMPEDRIWHIFFDLLQALKTLHDKNLLHLDIKLDNVLMGYDGTCKLADFGLVVDADKALNRGNNTTEGDSRYMAPELLDSLFTKAADVFSLGIAMLEICCFLELPKNGDLWHRLRSNQMPDQFFAHISPELQQIIRKMMNSKPQKRPTVDEILQHEKFAQIQRERVVWKSAAELESLKQEAAEQHLREEWDKSMAATTANSTTGSIGSGSNNIRTNNNCSTPDMRFSKPNFAMDLEEQTSHVGVVMSNTTLEDETAFNKAIAINSSTPLTTVAEKKANSMRKDSRRTLFPTNDEKMLVDDIDNAKNVDAAGAVKLSARKTLFADEPAKKNAKKRTHKSLLDANVDENEWTVLDDSKQGKPKTMSSAKRLLF